MLYKELSIFFILLNYLFYILFFSWVYKKEICKYLQIRFWILFSIFLIFLLGIIDILMFLIQSLIEYWLKKVLPYTGKSARLLRIKRLTLKINIIGIIQVLIFFTIIICIFKHFFPQANEICSIVNFWLNTDIPLIKKFAITSNWWYFFSVCILIIEYIHNQLLVIIKLLLEFLQTLILFTLKIVLNTILEVSKRFKAKIVAKINNLKEWLFANFK